MITLNDLVKKVDGWANDKPLLNLVVTSGFHGVVTALFGLVGLAAYCAFGYAVIKEGGGIVNRVIRGGALPRGWALADTIADAVVPVAVWLIFFL